MTLPVYTDILDVLNELQSDIEPSEMHGELCGLICAGDLLGSLAWLSKVLATPHIEEQLDEQGKALIRTIYAVSHDQLNNTAFTLDLLLPDDDASMQSRTRSLALWCHGFLAGIQLGGGYIDLKNDSEIAEAFNDLQMIARITPESTESEEQEKAYMEVVEYVRVAVMLIKEERLAKPEEVNLQ